MSRRGQLRQRLGAGSRSTHALIRIPARGLRTLARAGRRVHAFITDDAYRSIVVLRLFQGRALQQTTPLTWLDRYPPIFEACRDYSGRIMTERAEPLRILSYGCSTGEEVLTLRRYFPDAWIVGAEINRRSLAACHALDVDDRIRFVRSKPKEIGREGPFDLVFCMAVLQRTPHAVVEAVEREGLRSLASIYPFSKFEEQTAQLDGWVRPGGLLVLHHTQYVFADATVAYKYAPIFGHPEPTEEGPRFDANSRLIERTVMTPSIFVKREA